MYPQSFLDYSLNLGTRLTSLRKSILFILWGSKKPLKAYDILNALLDIKQNSKPTTVYRVLEHFADCGVVHKIESIQSYILCREPKKHLPSEVLMICTHCHAVQETYEASLLEMIQKLSDSHGFGLGDAVIELKGICRHCQKK